MASYDTRDNNYFPSRGIWFETIGTRYGEYVGGDFEYTKLTSFISSYYPVTEKVIIAGKLEGKFSDGDTLFYDLPNLSMRGFSQGRYIDNHTFATFLEARWKFYKRWSAIGFLEAGWGAI